MKNHKIINGKLLQTNKKFSQLKESQKVRINDWCYEEYKHSMDKFKIEPTKDEIVEKVYSQIEKAEIWIPFDEIYTYYEAHLSKFRKQYDNENI